MVVVDGHCRDGHYHRTPSIHSTLSLLFSGCAWDDLEPCLHFAHSYSSPLPPEPPSGQVYFGTPLKSCLLLETSLAPSQCCFLLLQHLGQWWGRPHFSGI
jgi:hypothetical protein